MGMRGVGTSVALAGMRVTLAALAAGCMAGQATASAAVEPGVHIDPGSPATKEYALPLEQARKNAAPGSSAQATPFGAGIKPPGGSSGGGSPRGSSRGGGSSPSGAPGAAGEPGAATLRSGAGPASPLGPAFTSAALRAASPSDDGSTLALLGGGVAVLILGGFGGTVLRHSRRPSASQ
jgi:hypothetical protein